jgi:alkylation response protein AidB-like acyl-CoA dehydrogenase
MPSASVQVFFWVVFTVPLSPHPGGNLRVALNAWSAACPPQAMPALHSITTLGKTPSTPTELGVFRDDRIMPSIPPPLTQFSDDENLLRQTVADLADQKLRPLVRRMDEEAHFDPGLLAEFFHLGLMGIQIPERYGGSGGSFFEAVIAVEELSRVDASAGVIVDVQNTLVNNALLRWATDEQKERYLPRLASEWVGAYALSEPGSGSDAFALQTRAERVSGGYRLNGRKLWITNALEARLFVLFANVNPEAGYRGITAFLVERATPGFIVGHKEDKLGIRASSTCELILEDCMLADAQVLGQVGRGYKIAIETLNEGRIGIGAQMIGVSRGALEAAAAYTRERRQFGKAISEFQAVQFQLAQAQTELEAARLMVYNAARLKDSGGSYVREAAMAKYFASTVAEHVTSVALELFGGYGYVKDYPVEKFFRDAKIGKIYEGTSNMQLQTIAKLMLG